MVDVILLVYVNSQILTHIGEGVLEVYALNEYIKINESIDLGS